MGNKYKFSVLSQSTDTQYFEIMPHIVKGLEIHEMKPFTQGNASLKAIHKLTRHSDHVQQIQLTLSLGRSWWPACR